MRIYAIRMSGGKSTHSLGANAPVYFGAFIKVVEVLGGFFGEIATIFIDFFAGMGISIERTASN